MAKTIDFFRFYESLSTRRAQKELRHEIILKCEIKKATFYSWLKRGGVPDIKNQDIITKHVNEKYNADIFFKQ